MGRPDVRSEFAWPPTAEELALIDIVEVRESAAPTPELTRSPTRATSERQPPSPVEPDPSAAAAGGDFPDVFDAEWLFDSELPTEPSPTVLPVALEVVPGGGALARSPSKEPSKGPPRSELDRQFSQAPASPDRDGGMSAQGSASSDASGLNAPAWEALLPDKPFDSVAMAASSADDWAIVDAEGDAEAALVPLAAPALPPAAGRFVRRGAMAFALAAALAAFAIFGMVVTRVQLPLIDSVIVTSGSVTAGAGREHATQRDYQGVEAGTSGVATEAPVALDRDVGPALQGASTGPADRPSARAVPEAGVHGKSELTNVARQQVGSSANSTDDRVGVSFEASADARRRLEAAARNARNAALGRRWNAAAHPEFQQALKLEERGLEELRAGDTARAAHSLAASRRLYDSIGAQGTDLSPAAAGASPEKGEPVPPGTARSLKTSVTERLASDEASAVPFSANTPGISPKAGVPPAAEVPSGSDRDDSPAIGSAVATGPGSSSGNEPTALAPDPSARSSPRLAVEPTAARPSDEQSIRAVLQKYRAAYERLDADAARFVWPSVDLRALSRAFNGLKAQQLDFQQCDVNVRGAGANASCQGTATYVPRVGSQQTRSEPRRWTFLLEKAKSGWVIVEAEVQ